jgi:hypothetical protein
MPQPIRSSAVALDLSPRIAVSKVVAGSPAAAAETIIASVTIPSFGDLSVVSGILLTGWAAFTVGTSGATARARIKQTDASGSAVVDTGLLTVTAGNLMTISAHGFDAAPGVATYALTLIIGSGAAASTVSAVLLSAIVV